MTETEGSGVPRRLPGFLRRVTRSGDAADRPCHMPFDESELELLTDVMAALKRTPDSEQQIQLNLDRLLQLGEIIHSFPSLYEESVLAGLRRTVSTLLEQLVHIGPLASPFRFPVKAVLARDFVLAKIQLFRSAFLALMTPDPHAHGFLCARLRAEIGQSIYTVLIEDILKEILLDLEIPVALRRRAGEWLVRFWDDSTAVEIDDFCPLLESAWSARNRLMVRFGTLMGSMEVVQLMAEAIDPRFMDFFCQEFDTAEKHHAFEEFLFGLEFEQIEVLHSEMNRQSRAVVDADWVAGTLEVPETQLFSGIEDPEAMFLSYHKRRRAAASRRARGVHGPRQAAEMFLVLYLLDREVNDAGDAQES